MITAEQYAEIRRLFFAEHWKVNTIAGELGLHHETVERRRAHPLPPAHPQMRRPLPLRAGACAPYRGNEKGKVERTIQYLRHGFFAARRFASVDDLDGQLSDWIERIAHARAVPGDPTRRPVSAALADERPRLLPLPAHRFACDHVRPIASGKQPYVRFDRNDYSIPHDRIRQTLTLIASETEVRVVDAGGTELARHVRQVKGVVSRLRRVRRTVGHACRLGRGSAGAHERGWLVANR
jgi:hypothetical protein